MKARRATGRGSDPRSSAALAERDGLVLRRLGPRDGPRLARWLSDPRVLEFYGGRDRPMTPAQVRAKYLRPRHDPATGRFFGYQPCVVELGGRPIGFVQYYRVPSRESTEWEVPPSGGAYGFDVFLGEPNLWGRGHGSTLVEMVRDYLLARRAARRILLDPRVDNPRAVHVYEKAGFRRLRRLGGRELHEGKACDCWLMEYP